MKSYVPHLFSMLLLLAGYNDVVASSREEELAKKSELLLAYFDCASYAELASPAAMADLFTKGVDVGRQFYEAMQNGETTISPFASSSFDAYFQQPLTSTSMVFCVFVSPESPVSDSMDAFLIWTPLGMFA
jgi:hypothetical protein